MTTSAGHAEPLRIGVLGAARITALSLGGGPPATRCSSTSGGGRSTPLPVVTDIDVSVANMVMVDAAHVMAHLEPRRPGAGGPSSVAR